MKQLVAFLMGALFVGGIWLAIEVNMLFWYILLLEAIPMIIYSVRYIQEHWDDK